ncbi:hypothetical protein Tco_0332034 [Tanacetum coccineum]
MAFPRLQELAVAQNSNNLTNAMSVYIKRKINDDLYFSAGLSHLWEVLYSRVNEHRRLIAELNMFGDKEVDCGNTDDPKWLRIITSPLFIKNRSQITEVDPPVVLFVNHIKSLFESDFVLLDPKLQSKKSDMDRSFTLGSTEEADNVKILQSCNGLLLCGGSRLLVFDYVYTPSTS